MKKPKSKTVYKPRMAGRCTCCSQMLPEDEAEWGLKWIDNAGMCVSCLERNREGLQIKSEVPKSLLQ